jgi:hypothetical protein
MAKQSEVHRGINPRYVSSEAATYINQVRRGMYGKLPNLDGLSYWEIVFLACVDGIAAELAKEEAANLPMTADQLRIKLMRNMAEKVLRAEGDVQQAYSPAFPDDEN